MSEQALDVRTTFRALSRCRLVLAAVTIVGVSLGLLFSFSQAPTFVARARVLLPPSPGLDAKGRLLRNIETEVHVARSAEIIDAAATRARITEDRRALRRRVTVKAKTGDIIEVIAESGSSGTAAALANAVADEYTAYANNASSVQADTTIRQLQNHAEELAGQIRDLEARITTTNARVASVAANSPEAVNAAALLTPLLAEQLNAEARLYSVNTRIGDMRLSAELSRGGTGVLEQATLPAGPARPRPGWNAAVGGLFGLVAGVVTTLRRAQQDVRLRRRDDIAGTVRAPVLVSLPVPPRPRVKTYRALLEEWEASAVEALALRHALARLELTREHFPMNVAVVTLGGDRPAAAVALKLAIFASRSGLRTALVVANAHQSTAELRLACAEGRPANPNLSTFGVAPDTSDGSGLGCADVTVTVIPFDPEDDLVVATWDRRTVTVLAVSSGLATAEALAGTSMACLDAGHPVQGIFVANPDPDDRTSGESAVLLPHDRGIGKVEGGFFRPARAPSGGGSSGTAEIDG